MPQNKKEGTGKAKPLPGAGAEPMPHASAPAAGAPAPGALVEKRGKAKKVVAKVSLSATGYYVFRLPRRLFEHEVVAAIFTFKDERRAEVEFV